jgi:hypothetical protein
LKIQDALNKSRLYAGRKSVCDVRFSKIKRLMLFSGSEVFDVIGLTFSWIFSAFCQFVRIHYQAIWGEPDDYDHNYDNVMMIL